MKHEHDFTDWEVMAWAKVKVRTCKDCKHVEKQPIGLNHD